MFSRAIMMTILIVCMRTKGIDINTINATDPPVWDNTTEPLTMLIEFGTEQVHKELCDNMTIARDGYPVIDINDTIWSPTSDVGPPGSLRSLNCLSMYDKRLVLTLLCTIHQMRETF